MSALPERLLELRDKLQGLPNADNALIVRNHTNGQESVEIVVTHKNRRDQVAYQVDNDFHITGAEVRRQPLTARERLASMSTPTDAISAFVLLLTADEAALDAGIISTEDVQRTWRGIKSSLQERQDHHK